MHSEHEHVEPVHLTVIDTEQWEPCSPAWLERGGNCATAPRVWNVSSNSHYHPRLSPVVCPEPAVDIAAARRWLALVGCARIRPLCSAGLVKPNPQGHAHLGLELWTHFPEADRCHAEHVRGVEWLTQFADAAAVAAGPGAPLQLQLASASLEDLEQRLAHALPAGDGDYDDGYRDALHSISLALLQAGLAPAVLGDAITTALDAHSNNVHVG